MYAPVSPLDLFDQRARGFELLRSSQDELTSLPKGVRRSSAAASSGCESATASTAEGEEVGL